MILCRRAIEDNSIGFVRRIARTGNEAFRIVPPVATARPKKVFPKGRDEIEQCPTDDHIVVEHTENTVDDHREAHS